MPHPLYRNPPIVEAVVALAFAPASEWSSEQVDALKRGLGAEYGGRERVQTTHLVQATFAPGTVSTSASSAAHRFLLPTRDDRALVGFGENVLSVHVLAPYPGWDSFRRRIESALDQVRAVRDPGSVVEVAVRYIDRIAVPEGTGDGIAVGNRGIVVSEYFAAVPPRPPSMPSDLAAYQSVLEALDPQTGTVAALTIATVPPAAGEAYVILYDLNLVQRFEPGRPVADVWDTVEALHDRQYQIFEESITDKTRGLFA